MAIANPTEVRMSEHFMLSDLMGCNSVYAKGLRNVFDRAEKGKLREGRTLAENLLEPLVQRTRLSVTYGFISPELSRHIVKYQNPDLPSYHRWDAGAACDVVMHQYIHAGLPPIYGAFWVDDNLPASRTITYSESPCICVATKAEEIVSGNHRHALYENRYMGERKPLYVPYSKNARTRIEQQAALRLEHDWRGGGFPSYHGGGTRQAQHIRTSKYTLLSDFLMSTQAMTEGHANMPANLSQRGLSRFRRAGRVVDGLLEATGARRFSIVQAFQSEEWRGDAPGNWKDGAYLILVPPASMHPDTLAHEAAQIGAVSEVGVASNRRVWLKLLDKDENEGCKKVQVGKRQETAEAPVAERGSPRLRRTRAAT